MDRSMSLTGFEARNANAVVLGVVLTSFAGCGGAESNAPGRPGRLAFVERAKASGVEFFHVCGGKEKDYILEVNGGGCALFDYDLDGDLDVFLVNGARFADDPAGAGTKPPSDALFRNDGNWRFCEVTHEAGLEESAWGCGCAVADVENDGDLDLFVANYGPDELWLNDGDGTFSAAAARLGVADPGWGSSAAFVDYDRDGDVDLFVVNYLDFEREKVKPRGPDSCLYKGQRVLCGPFGLPQAFCSLFRNDGDRFADVSGPSGVRAKSGYGLGVTVGDYDRDGWPDIYVASDSTENLLFRNRGDGSFEELGALAGVARNDQAVAQAGMGVEFAFVRSSEIEDLFVVNYEDDNNTYYQNDGNGFFTELTSVVGLAPACFKHLGWGCFFADFDFDADLDLFIAQGHVVPQADQIPSSPGYRQVNKLFLNDGKGFFTDASDQAGPAFQVKKSSRGASCGDLDGDGDLDMVVNAIDDHASLLECVGAPLGHWIGVGAEGTRSNRAAIGAVVRVAAAGKTQARRVQSATGYASHSELTQRFGLGAGTQVERIEVEWPSGLVEEFAVEEVDRIVHVREGSGRMRAARSRSEEPGGGR
jgi:hypothetical protein